MKQLIVILSILLVLVFVACEEKALDPVLALGNVPSITAPSANASFTLVEADADVPLTTFAWTASEFGFDAAVNYRLEFDVAGNNFADPLALFTVNDLSFDTYTQGQLNNVMLTKGLPGGAPSLVDLRICAKVSDGVEQPCSAPITIEVITYAADIVFPKLQVPGSYQDWDPANEETVVFSRLSNEVYEGYIYFNIDDALYKFTKGPSWDVNWGDEELDGILDPGGLGNDIPITEGAGMYFLHADLNTFMHFNLKTNWSAFGSATGDQDLNFEWDDGKKALSLTNDLSAGDFIFRANATNDINFGDDFANGTLENDGAAIEIGEAGNYTIDLELDKSTLKYTATKN